ncbi:MAG: hypothetical protein GWP91_14145 [Rhodobacterales bacterium]|nr:hypothetical protein [Rhodobacterales bacterium]
MDRADIDEPTRALLTPVAALISHAVALLPPCPPLRIRVGDVPGFYRLEGRSLILSEHLVTAKVHHPEEPVRAMPPLDRWRRAAGSVLESVALLGMSKQLRRSPGRDWRWQGAAIDLVDQACPELELAQPDVAEAIRLGDPGRHPRTGVVVFRAWRHQGVPMAERRKYLLEGGVVSAKEWAEIGLWVMSGLGAGAALPVLVPSVSAVDVPAGLTPWSWRRLSVPPHVRGGYVAGTGDVLIAQPWAKGGEALKTLAACTAQLGEALPESGGPLGQWEIASAQGFGQVMGARGVQFDFKSSGVLQLTLADAFVGPLAALAMAEEMGTSGVANGSWRVAGRLQLGFAGIASHGLTVHGRGGDGFMMPSRGFGLGEWLTALEEAPWAWQVNGDRLVMRGRMMGGAVEVRLKRVVLSPAA